jgi:hypothetical protein
MDLVTKAYEEARKAYQEIKLEWVVAITEPVVCQGHDNVEIMMVSTHKHHVMTILAIKSLFHSANTSFPVTIIDDAYLSDRAKARLRHHLKGVRIIDDEMYLKAAAKKFGRKSLVFSHSYLPYVRKKAGVVLFSKKKKIIVLDSDVLFFKRPYAVLFWIKSTKDALYISDCEDSYSLSQAESLYYFKKKFIHKVNSGLIGVRVGVYKVELLEKVLRLHKTLSVGRPYQLQVFFAVLFAFMKKGQVQKLPAEYVVSLNPNDFSPEDNTVGHYVGPVREKYFIDYPYVIEHVLREKKKRMVATLKAVYGWLFAG